MKQVLHLCSKIRGLFSASQCSDVGYDCRLTVVRPSFDCRSTVLKLCSILVIVLTVGVGNVWGDETITEDFENSDQEIHVDAQSNPVYNDQTTYDEEDSNAEIGWFVEHGTVSTDVKISGDRSLQMRAYYSKSSAQGTWNGALPYLESTTAVTGLKSITFKAKVSSTTNQSLLVDIKYSTDGSSWSAMKTNAVTPADATGIAYTTSATSYTYNIPSSSSSTSYYIKIAVSSSSRHTTNVTKAGSKGNIKLIVDDIVFTYASSSPSCADPSAPEKGSVSSTGATISEGTSGNYNIYYSTSSSTPSSSTSALATISSGTSVDITGLKYGTTYYYWAQKDCGGGSVSNYVAGSPTSFTTTCPNPTSISAGAITKNGATFTITDNNSPKINSFGSGYGYDIYWNTSSTPAPDGNTTPSATTEDLSKTVTGLTAGTTYYYWVRGKGPNAKSSWVAGTGTTFTTLHEYTLSYKETDGTANGSGTVVENATSFTNTSAPSKTGHDLEGFYAENTLTTKVANASREFVANVSNWTGTGGAYTKGENANLYLKWTPQTYTISSTLTGCSWETDIADASYEYTGDANAVSGTVNPSSGKGCPSSITVTMGGSTLTPSTDYTWSVNTAGVGTFLLKKVITGNVVVTITAQPMVTWMAGGSVFSTQVADANTALSSPGTPSPATYCPGGKVFVGWSANTIVGTSNTQPTDLFTDATKKKMPAGGITYYAVYATSSGTPSTSYAAITSGLASGDYVIAYEYNNNGTRVALQNVTDNSSPTTRMEGYALARDGSGKYANPAATYIWQLQKQNDGSYYIYDLASGMYLNATTSALQLSTTATKYDISYDGTNSRWTIQLNSNTSYYVHGYVSGTSYDFRVSTDASDGKYRTYLYKNEGSQTFSAYATNCCTDAGSLSASVTGTTHNAATVSWTIPVDGSSNKKQAGVIVRIYADNAGAKGDEITAKRGDYSSDNSTTSHEFTSLTPDTKYWWTIEGVGKTVAGTTYCDIAQTTPASFTTQPACDDYSFHYGTNGNGASWQILCFENVTSTSEWIIEDFTIPSTNHLYVGYQNDFKDGSAGNKLSTNSASANVAWTTDPTKGGGSVWQGQIHLVPYNTSANDLGNWGVGQATGATGTLSIWDNSNDKNLFVGFEPDGYGITFGGNSYAFGDATDHERETEVVTLPASLSTTYSVGLKTASGYVDCAHSNNEATFATMATTEVEGGKIKISMVPNSDWKAASPKFAIWDATHSKWGTSGEFMTKISDDLYEGYVSSGTSTIVIARIDPSKDSPDWSWNQTVNISLSTLNTKFTITSKVGGDGSDKDKYNVSAAAHNPTASAHGKFRMWDNNSLKNWCCHFVPYYKLTYNANGGSNAPAAVYGNSEETDNVTVNNGSGLTPPTGKHFVKWNTANDGSGEDVAAGSYTLTEDLEIFAIYDWDYYTVTVNKSGCASATVGANKTTSVHYGETITLSADEPAGYAFVNWTTSDGVTFSPNATTKGATFTMPASNVTVQANYHQIYTITWKVNNVALTGDALDGADVNVEQGSNLANVPSTAPADNSLNNCANKFMGWSKTNIAKGSPVNGTANINALKLFKTASEFVDGGGTITENTTFYAVFAEADGADVDTELWTEDWTGASTYTSAGDSYTASANYGRGTTTYNNTTLTYSQTDNTVYCRADKTAGGTAPELMITANKTWTVSGIPTGNAATLSLYYMSNYELNVTTTTPNVSVGSASSLSNLRSRTITIGGDVSTFNLSFANGATNARIDNIVLYVASQTFSNYVTQCADNQVRVTYDANGGSAPSCASGVTTKNASYTVCSTEPTRDYYDFGGWNDGTSTYAAGASYNLSANTTFTAQWTPTTYNISYELDGGTNNVGNPATYNVTTATITLQDPTKGHDRFEGWFKTYSAGVYSDQVTSIPLGSHGDITLYAKWTERHEIVFDADGTTTTIYRAEDEDLSASVAGQGSVPSDPSAPSACSSKVFMGWSESEIDGETDTEPADLMKPAAGTVDEDKHYYAVWADESSESGTVKLIDDAFNVTGTDAVTSRSGWTSLSTIYGGSGSIRFSSGNNHGSMKLVKTGMGFGTNVTSATITFKIKKYSGSETSGTLTIGSDWVNDNTTKFSKDGGVNKASSVTYTTSDASNWTSCTCNVYDINSNTEIILDGTTNQRIHVKDFLMTYTGTVYTYDKYATSCCATKVTLSDNSPSNGTIAFGKTTVPTCGEDKEVSLTITPNAGYQLTGWTVATGDGKVAAKTTSPAVVTNNNSSAAQNITLTFAEDANGAYAVTATFGEMVASAWTWTNHVGGAEITTDPVVVYVGQKLQADVAYSPAGLLASHTNNSAYNYPQPWSNANLGSPAKAGDHFTVTGTNAGSTSVTLTHNDGLTKTIYYTVLAKPLVHFVDNVHNESFSDVEATIINSGLGIQFTQQTPTHADYTGSTLNSCEETHLHLVGWIDGDWTPYAEYMDGTGAKPTESEITGATGYFYAPGADIDVSAKDGKTYYAVWAKVE